VGRSPSRPRGKAGVSDTLNGALFAPIGQALDRREAADVQPAPAKPTKAAKDAAAPHYHDHRARLRARFAKDGAEALAEYELLELVLFRSIPRKDTKPIAKALIARFGDVSGVLGAPAGLLAEVEGVGQAVAGDLKALQALFVRAARADARQRPVLSSWTTLVTYLRLSLQHETREQVRVLYLDVKNQLIADESMADGTVDQAPVYPREVVRRALQHDAAALIMVHNHPSGDPKPSPADVAITRELAAAAKALGLKLHDHVIVARQGVASLKQMGLM
jgi:DNA repair protein RadC